MRKFYYRYELNLQHTSEKAALTFGSAWHRAMEARWDGALAEQALTSAIGEVENLDELQVATLTGLLTGYYKCYTHDPIKELQPEQEFQFPLAGSRTFDVAGKIDGLGIHEDGRPLLLEHKTTSDSVAPDSDYWNRLRCNNQSMQYVHAARLCGLSTELIFYDVTRKPSIRPKTIPKLDEAGKKIVLVDATGERALKKDGAPRESAGEGMTLQTRNETAEEYGQRLTEDAIARPEFYFARREVPVLDQDLNEFVVQRLEISRMILALRRASRSTTKPHQAWPRNCSSNTCDFCEFKDFCLQNIEVNPAQPPAGFIVGNRNPELTAGK
jgi:hypothetical protein